MTHQDRPGLLARPATPEQQEWLERVEKLAPIIGEHRDQAERDRVMPRAVFEALRDAGITRMWVSRAFGGAAVSAATGIAVLEALARLDASVAWQMAVQGAEGRLSDYLPDDRASQLFAHNTDLVVGVVKPSGQAVRVDGGFVVSGQWPFASGSAHAGWLACCAFVVENGERVMTPYGPDTRVCMVPRSEVEIVDTWYTLGLRGTGSNDLRVASAFVPDDLVIPRSALRFPPPSRPSRAFPVSYFDFGPLAQAPTSLGIAADALEAFKELALDKTPTSGTVTLATSQTVQEKLGRAEMLVYSARQLLLDAADTAFAYPGTGGDALSAVVRLTGATVAENVIRAVGLLFETAGSTSMYTSSRLERCFRDINTSTKHISMSASHYEMAGQYLLGGGLQIRR